MPPPSGGPAVPPPSGPVAPVSGPATGVLVDAEEKYKAEDFQGAAVIFNAVATGKTPGADPYQRKTISFQSVMDENAGADLVQVDQISRDETPFETQYMPGNAAADSNGMVNAECQHDG